MIATDWQMPKNPNRVRAGTAINRTARENFVYWVLDTDGNTLYIGCTRCPDRRWVNHRHTNPILVANAARFRLRGPYTRAVARRIEKAAIRAEDPLFNHELPRREKAIKLAEIERRYGRRAVTA